MIKHTKLTKVLIGIGIALIFWIAVSVYVELKFGAITIGSLNRTGGLLIFYAEKTGRFPESENDLITTLRIDVKKTENGIMYTSSDPNNSYNKDWIGIPLFYKFQIRYGTKKIDLISLDKKLYLRGFDQQFFFIDGPCNNWFLFKGLYEKNSFKIYEMMKE